MRNKWVYLIVLSLIWGSSYILIKKALLGFTPFQLGGIRIVISAMFLFTFGLSSLKGLTRKQWKWIAVSGVVGSFVPVFLFAFAQTEIDSSITSILNSLVPLFTIIVGYTAFRIHFAKNQFAGVLVGLFGAVLLIYLGAEFNPDQNYYYALLIILATIGYAFNANIIKKKLSAVSPRAITVGNFVVMVVPALFITVFSGVFSAEVVASPKFYPSLGYVVILAIFGTSLAKIMFNRLIHISSPVFSVSVTYLIPVVGIGWGLVDGERFSLWQLLAAGIILTGVYLVNYKRKG